MLLMLNLLFTLAATPTQTEPTSSKQQRAANRQALRDARRTDAPYKESHLTVTPEQLRRGNAAGPPGTANQPNQGTNGRAHHFKSLHLGRRTKSEPTL